MKNRYKKLYPKNENIVDSIHQLSDNQAPRPIDPVVTYDSSTVRNIFILNMYKCIGETVTVFVNAGGMSGLGFTGVLLNVNNTYLQLTSVIGSAPGCALANGCFYGYLATNSYYQGQILPNQICTKSFGSSTYIPVDKIASFIHNLV